MPRGFHKSGIRKGRRKGSPRIVKKLSWLNRSKYPLMLAMGKLNLGVSSYVWLNDGTGGISNPWDNSEVWENG